MEITGALEIPTRTSYSALTNTLGTPILPFTLISPVQRSLFRYGGYTRGWAHGVRNLLFTSPDPTAGVKTWIREEDGTVKASITLDSNYV